MAKFFKNDLTFLNKKRTMIALLMVPFLLRLISAPEGNL